MRKLIVLATTAALLTGIAATPVPTAPPLSMTAVTIGKLAYQIMAEYPNYRCFTFTGQSFHHPENFSASIVCFVEAPHA
jgi:hypothetical protein